MHFAPQATRPGRDHKCAARGSVEELFQLILCQVYIVDENQRLLVLKGTPDLGLGWLRETARLVEAFEQKLLEIDDRLTACGEIDDAIAKRLGSRVMGQVT